MNRDPRIEAADRWDRAIGVLAVFIGLAIAGLLVAEHYGYLLPY